MCVNIGAAQPLMSIKGSGAAAIIGVTERRGRCVQVSGAAAIVYRVYIVLWSGAAADLRLAC